MDKDTHKHKAALSLSLKHTYKAKHTITRPHTPTQTKTLTQRDTRTHIHIDTLPLTHRRGGAGGGVSHHKSGRPLSINVLNGQEEERVSERERRGGGGERERERWRRE